MIDSTFPMDSNPEKIPSHERDGLFRRRMNQRRPSPSIQFRTHRAFLAWRECIKIGVAYWIAEGFRITFGRQQTLCHVAIALFLFHGLLRGV